MEITEKKAILYMILSACFFSLMQFFVKISGDNISIMMQVFFRNFVTLIISSLIMLKNKESFLPKKENIIWLSLRSMTGFFGVVGFFYATKHMYLADANILQRSSPIFIIILSFIFLKTPLQKTHILALILALMGSIFVIKPKMDSSIIPSVIGLLSAVFAGASYTIISFMKGRETGNLIIFYFSLFSSILSLILSYDTFIIPNTMGIIMLLAISVSAALGQFFVTTAYKNGNPNSISIFNYSGIIISFILGVSILHEVINIFSIIGIILITASGLIIYLKKA